MVELHTSLIKSGGGNGPMKPGNLRKRGAKSGGKTKDEDSIYSHIESSVCGFSLFGKCERKESENYGKKTVYF